MAEQPATDRAKQLRRSGAHLEQDRGNWRNHPDGPLRAGAWAFWTDFRAMVLVPVGLFCGGRGFVDCEGCDGRAGDECDCPKCGKIHQVECSRCKNEGSWDCSICEGGNGPHPRGIGDLVVNGRLLAHILETVRPDGDIVIERLTNGPLKLRPAEGQAWLAFLSTMRPDVAPTMTLDDRSTWPKVQAIESAETRR